MQFRLTGLPAGKFRHLYGLPDEALRACGVRRLAVEASPGFPDRVELRDADPGERVLLLNYAHQPADNPYRSSHAIFVIEGAAQAYDRIGEVPDVLRMRPLSLRAFDRFDLMIDADLVDGRYVESLVERLLLNPETAYIHVHYARRGCYAARIDRA
jgi:hypothetical protein